MPRIILITLFVAVFCCTIPESIFAAGQTTVVWVSIDGFRGDYLARIKPPTLSRLAREGAMTTQERPIFPSLTFPNHVAQVTGSAVDRHGIVMNSFFDAKRGKTFNFPDDGTLLRDEPIWITAKRQGVRVAVIDWPLSHGQSGPLKSDYFEPHFDSQETDPDRLDHVVDLLNADHGDKPLQLIMTYVSHVDTIGHRFGPESTEVRDAVLTLDGTLDRFITATTKWFDAAHAPTDDLYFLFTTDHGMKQVHTLVNLDRLIGADLLAKAKIVTSGPMASVYLGDVAAEQRASRAGQIVAKLKESAFLQAWLTQDVPKAFHYSDPDRLGDVVVLLSPGYVFSGQRLAATRPASLADGHATHGYDPAVCPEMLGGAIVWRYHHPLGGRNLGPIDNTQWHSTVARLLGIQPSPDSDPRAIVVP